MDSLILNSVAHILLLLPTTDPKNEEKTGLNYLMMVISDTQYIFDRIPPGKRNAPLLGIKRKTLNIIDPTLY